MGVFRGYLLIFVCASFPFGFEGGTWDLIVLIPDQCLSIYFTFYRFCFLIPLVLESVMVAVPQYITVHFSAGTWSHVPVGV